MKSTYSVGTFSQGSPYHQRYKPDTNSFIGPDDLTDNEDSDFEGDEWKTR